MRIPISFKLIIITVLLLLGVTIPIAIVSSSYFEKRSMQREEDINVSFASARATEIENILNSIVEKSRNAGLMLYKAHYENKELSEEFDLSFKRDKSFLSVEVVKIADSSVQSVAKRLKNDLLQEQYQTDELMMNQIRSWQQFPIRNLTQGSIEVQNATFAKGPPMFTVGIPLVKDNTGRITHVVLADISLSVLQKPFSEISERTFFVTDRRGLLLAHTDEQMALQRLDYSKTDIFKLANTGVMPKGQGKVPDPKTQALSVGAFAKTSYGVTVFSLIPEDVILEPAREVRRKAFFIAGSFLSASLFLVFLFSLSLTSPIEKLAELIGFVSKGDFNVSARKKIKTIFKDEVTELANAFDHMTEGLKERDKVKNLFSKFHGSSVTEDLLQGDVIGVGGQKKPVVVFFSDIRGFTAFSEKRAPEDVVKMLNEYFAVMVEIINRNGGVVDKFIGDAIMAVWGAPKGSKDDAKNAVRACLEMRLGLKALNERRMARGETPIQIGMGLHAGEAISGTIGSEERMEYTVIGNTVNTASRVEASTKAFGADLLVTDEVLSQVGDEFLTEFCGEAEVKGRSVPLKYYKVRAYKDHTSGNYVEVKTEWSDYEPEAADKVKVKKAEVA
ncbi:MAG: HAMP domain-containing protein [Bdellovibrionaceae bacterium]|nr:HAMP domain-containing protein [Pseudobdellovibrionaceae bacterium]